jgi:hypothetical protein
MPNPMLPSFAQVRAAMMKATGGAGFSFQMPPVPPPETPEGERIPDPIDPQAEGRQSYLAYRGTEMHGVESPDPTMAPDAEGYGPGTVDVIYDDEPRGGHVLDVRVIPPDSAETLAAWRVNQLTAPPAGNPPQNIAGRNRSRTSLKIKNMSATDGIWVGPTAELSAFNGYLIEPHGDLTLSSTESVFALANSASVVAVCTLSEFTQEA